MSAMLADKRFLHFHTDALADDTLLVARVVGEEALSRPYRFEIELASLNGSLDLDALLAAPAKLTIVGGTAAGGRASRRIEIHGALAEVEQLDDGPRWSNYRVALAPRLAAFALGQASRVFQDLPYPRIIAETLKNRGLTEGQDFEFRLSGQHPDREYVVQYQESDLDFLSRLAEHEGIYYFFEQGDRGEKIVFADNAGAPQPLPDGGKVRYRASAGMADFSAAAAGGDAQHEEVVTSLVGKRTAAPEKVVLKDYNYRKPSVELKAEASADDKGRGTLYEYGEHFKDGAEGKALAQVRAEEVRCRARGFFGRGDVRALTAGATFTLEDHPRRDWNASFLVVAVEHRAAQSLDVGPAKRDDEPDYANTFEAIPADVVFRPARTTPWPRIAGPINAVVDASGGGEYAEIDDHGRYRVQLPFDLSGKGGGKASRPLRMSQPYAGADMGMHFPLHKGTEVLVAHIDGDPDRPLIAAAVPNPETASPVTSQNQTQCAVRTGGGNFFVIEDTKGSQQIALSSPHAGTSLTMGANDGSKEGVALATGANLHEKIGGDENKQVDGSVAHLVNGNQSLVVAGNLDEKVSGTKSATTIGTSNETTIGAKFEKNMSAKQEVTLGVNSCVSGGLKSEMGLAGGLSVMASKMLKFTMGNDVEINPSKKKESAKQQEAIGKHIAVIGEATENVGKSKLMAGLMETKVGKSLQTVGQWVAKVATWEVNVGKQKTKAAKSETDAGVVMIKSGGSVLTVKPATIKAQTGGASVQVTPGCVNINGGNLKILI